MWMCHEYDIFCFKKNIICKYVIVLFYGFYTNFLCINKKQIECMPKKKSLYSTCKMHGIQYLAANFLII